MTHIIILLCLCPEPLVADLTHPSFRRRETAQRSLTWMGVIALPTIMRTIDNPPDIETQRRCSRIVEPHWARMCKQRVTRWQPLPFLDQTVCGYYLDMDYIAYYHYYALGRDTVSRSGSPGYLEFREAARLLVTNMLTRGVSHSTILHFLGRLASEEYDWLLKNGQLKR